MEVLNELYFGKPKVLLKAEEVLNRIRENCKPVVKSPNVWDVNKDPSVKTFGNMLKDQFNFGNVIFSVIPGPRYVLATVKFAIDTKGNAYSDDDDKTPIPMKEHLVVSKDGVKWDGKGFSPNILIVASAPLLANDSFTTEELMACILHEIGHSFYMSYISTYKERADEKMADQFSAMYGYGPELITGLQKLNDNYFMDTLSDSLIKRIPVLNMFYCAATLTIDSLTRLFGGIPHPTLRRRTDDIIRQMEADLNSTPNLTKKAREDLQKLIDRAKKNCEDYWSKTSGIKDFIYKKFQRHISPNNPVEIYSDRNSEKIAGPNRVNRILLKFGSGKFRSYKLGKSDKK